MVNTGAALDVPNIAWPVAHDASSNPTLVQAAAGAVLESLKRQMESAPAKTCRSGTPASGKFAAAGVPPGAALAVQLPALAESVPARRLASVAPTPSAATGHSSESP